MMFMNARMYSVSAATRTAWTEVFEWVNRNSGLAPMMWLHHDPPLLISDMWRRNDLGCAMMCGLPTSLRHPAPTILATVVPSPARYAGQPVYMTDLAVRADAPFQRLEDTFGGVAGTTVPDSQSGYFAFRYRLIDAMRAPTPVYRKMVGHLLNARGVISALVRGEIDIGPLDGYVHDLLRATEPEFAGQVRILETTAPTPMPPVVATAPLSTTQTQALRDAFQAAGSVGELAHARRTLLIDRFCLPDITFYDTLRERAHRVAQSPLPWPIGSSTDTAEGQQHHP
jgi:ABC-type phosphate/phosphonate transport system substrate-binding protein